MIYCSVRVVPESMPPFVEEGKLEALALLHATQFRKAAAEEAARRAADLHGFTFQVYTIQERLDGAYKPKGSDNDDACILART